MAEQQTGFPWSRPASLEEAAAALGKLTDKINAARRIAMDLCLEKGRRLESKIPEGYVASYQVLRVMRERGLLSVGERCHWVGRVFGHPMFEWTGESVSYRDKERNVHESTVCLWKLRKTEVAQ